MAGITHDEFEQHTRDIQRQLDKLLFNSATPTVGAFAGKAEVRQLRDVVKQQQAQIEQLYGIIESIAIAT